MSDNDFTLTDPTGRTSYRYDELNRLMDVTSRQVHVTRFTYDALSRLTDATHPAASRLGPEFFRYDPVGNRTASHLAGTYRVDAANRLLEDETFTYTSDANGNRTTRTSKAAPGTVETFTYDPEDQLIGYTAPGTTATYRYDALGRRIEKVVNGTVTRFTYDPEDQVVGYAAPQDALLEDRDIAFSGSVCYGNGQRLAQ